MMDLLKVEKKAIFFSFLAISIFICTRLFHEQLSFFYNNSHYLLYHTILELFSVFVSYSIFFYGWFTFPHTRSCNLFILSMVFFAVGTFDLFHTFSYHGSPFLQQVDQFAAPTWLWIIARFTESIGLISVLLINEHKKVNNKYKNWIVLLTIVCTFLVTISVLKYSSQFPILLEDGIGVTSLKITFEYIITFFHFTSLILIIRIYLKSNRNKPDHLTIGIGIVFIITSELIFTLYHHPYDLDNLLGHLYKFIGYFFLFKGAFFPQFEKLFKQMEKVEFQWHKAEEKLKAQEKKITTLILKAQEDERKRVSQELHDGIGQMLYSILISLKGLRKKVTDEQLSENILEIEKMTSNTMNEVKNIAHMLRPSALDDLGFIPAIRSHISQFEKTFHIKVDLHIDGSQKRVSPEVETALFRICQEALINAAKYSKATSIDVIILIIDDRIELTVVDNGVGFNMDEIDYYGLGLFSMRERAEIVNGKTTIMSNKGLGTQVHVAIPI